MCNYTKEISGTETSVVSLYSLLTFVIILDKTPVENCFFVQAVNCALAVCAVITQSFRTKPSQLKLTLRYIIKLVSILAPKIYSVCTYSNNKTKELKTAFTQRGHVSEAKFTMGQQENVHEDSQNYSPNPAGKQRRIGGESKPCNAPGNDFINTQ